MRAADYSLGRSVETSMGRLFAVTVGVLGTLMIAEPGLASPSLTETAQRDKTVLTPSDNPAMNQAFARARSELDQFLQRARNPGSDEHGFSVKILVRQGGHTEYFWITPFQDNQGRFTGTVSNRPEFVRNVKKGETVTFSRADIVDWMYLKGSAMQGNYTACALLVGRPAAEVAQFKKAYGLQC